MSITERFFPKNAISATQIHKTTRQNWQEKFCLVSRGCPIRR